MKILMIDVGGTNVKLMVSGQEEVRKVPSGSRLTGRAMVRQVLKATRDWEYDAITIGYPGLIADGKPVREPLNLGGGWLRLDYRKAFKKPVRFINDAAMQALGSYEGGRLLFLGFGTSTGAALIVDDVIVPIEIGLLRLPKGHRFMDRLADEYRERRGRRKWLRHVYAAIDMLRDVFRPDDIVLGGGNAKDIEPLPEGCRVRQNSRAIEGAERLWAGSGKLVEAHGTSWRIQTRKRRPEKGRRRSVS